MIYLVGPGGAGKTTAGAALAERLGISFVDLDAAFRERHGDISVYLNRCGYDVYARQSVDLFAILARAQDPPGLIALSSGFMTYRDDVHPAYVSWRRSIGSGRSTFVLLPSLDLEDCVAEIVRRQRTRPFARTAEGEEHVIRARFPIYAGLPARKVETMRPLEEVVAELAAMASG